MKKRILLTGGGGFVGRNLIEQYGEAYHFFAPTHKDLDLTDAAAVAAYVKVNPVDLVIHAANIGGNSKTRDLQNIVEINLRMFFAIAQLASKVERIIFLGSGAEYGKQDNIAHVKESDFGARMPADSYGFYKYACSKFIEKSDNIVNLRIFGLYGPHEDRDIRFISQTILKGMRGEPLTIYQNVRFEYMHIDDLLAVIGHFIERKPKEKFYNMGVNDPVDLLTLVADVEAAIGKKIIYTVAKPGMASEYTCDSNRLIQEVPDLVFVNRREAIRKLYDWYKKTNA